jgi:hypothetical protein
MDGMKMLLGRLVLLALAVVSWEGHPPSAEPSRASLRGVSQVSSAPARSAAARPRGPALGFQLDLFPTVISAVNGKAGYAPQLWVGIEPVRLRLITAHLEPPNSLTFDPEVVKPMLTVLATTLDYTFGKNLDGVWLGAGTEAWFQRARAKDGSGQAAWTSAVFTVGGGYIWRFAGNFYLDPWLGLHWILNSQRHAVGNVQYSPAALSLSASVKVGWFFWTR